MSEQEKDLFETTSGLPLDGATVTVVGSEFCFDNTYADQACVLALQFQNEEDPTTEPRRQLYSTGKNFEPIDQGDAVHHTSGKVVQFSSNSNIGRLITQTIKNCPDFRDFAREKGLQPDSALLWLGCRFKLGGYKYTDMGGKEKELMVPVEFLGTVDDAPKSTAKASTSKASAPKTSAPAVEDSVREELLELARSTDDYDEYLEKLMEKAAGDKAIEKAGMGQKAGSVWSEAHPA